MAGHSATPVLQYAHEPEAPVMKVADLRIQVGTRRGFGVAVDGVSFDLKKGKTLGLIGESGSGKSLTALALLDLLQKGVLTVSGGRIEYDGKNLRELDAETRRAYRGRHISMVLQDPLGALNPVLSIRNQIFEALRLHHGLKGTALRERAIELLQQMRIPSPEARLDAYPHEMSGGMRQRVVGAIALAGDPEVLVADEPTTALDVTVQAAYLELLKKIQRERGMAILFITHDFAVVGEICDEVAVMYAGRIVEKGSTAEVFGGARHPYTKALIKAVPDISEKPRELAAIPGTPPSVFAMPSGCRFHPRCWLHESLGCPVRCRDEIPEDREISPGHSVACHFTDEASAAEATHASAKGAV
jgi:oligopeptide/dipeptide ABC transporter ATP-binding protein